MRPATLVEKFSAGGLVFRILDRRAEIVLVSVKGGTIWTLPKGLVDEGESVEETALREVREETGLNARIIGEIKKVRYWYYMRSENTKCRKTVTFFLMEYIDGDVSDHDSEVEDAAWVALDDAGSRLTYPGDREVVRLASEMIRERLGRNSDG